MKLLDRFDISLRPHSMGTPYGRGPQCLTSLSQPRLSICITHCLYRTILSLQKRLAPLPTFNTKAPPCAAQTVGLVPHTTAAACPSAFSDCNILEISISTVCACWNHTRWLLFIATFFDRTRQSYANPPLQRKTAALTPRKSCPSSSTTPTA